MVRRCGVVLAALVWGLIGAQATALSPGHEVVVPAVARGAGASGSLWVTSLVISNPGDKPAAVTVEWLVRGQANPQPESFQVTVAGGATTRFDDVLSTELGLEAGGGALRVVADQAVVVLASILNRAGGSEFGQGFEGVPTALALRPRDRSTVLEVAHDTVYRTNVYLVDASGNGSTATVSLVDPEGSTLATKTYQLDAFMPILEPMSALGVASVAHATLRITVDEGAVIAGASRVAEVSGDPLTLPASIPAGASGVAQCAPQEITGLSARMVHPIFDGADEESIITIISEDAATLTDGPLEYTATFEYVPFGTGAIVTADIPDISLSNIRASFLCSSATTAAFVAVADSPSGEMTIEGTAVLLP